MPELEPLVRSLPAPAALVRALRRRGVRADLLESGLDLDGLGRRSYVLGYPLAVARADAGGELTVVEGPADLPRSWPGDPLVAARELLDQLKPLDWEREPGTFNGGAVLALSFDLGRRYERLPSGARADLTTPDLHLAVYEQALEIDPAAERLRVVGHGPHGPALLAVADEVLRAEERASAGETRCTFDAAGYREIVERAKAMIRRGDLFEVNLSRRYTVEQVDPDRLYARMRERSPAPFMADIDLGEGRRLLSASPERFLRLCGRRAESWPIKGTRKRGATPDEDAAQVADLLGSEKDAAELAMIVDLVRNDLGRVATPGTVRVREPRLVQSWPTVHHTVAVVDAELEAGRDGWDLIRAAFPPGSVTGAPKIRALEVIDELEPVRRGLYCGAFGHVGWDGELDLAVAIRIALCEGGRAHVHAGGAVLLDSDAAAEEEETVAKAAALLAAAREAGARG